MEREFGLKTMLGYFISNECGGLLWTINDFQLEVVAGWVGNDPPLPQGYYASTLLQISKVFKRFPGKHLDIAKKNPKPNRQIELNWSKHSIFWDLEYWPFLLLKHNLDVMHIEKNALEALLNTLLQNDKTKDTVKARQDLETLKVRKELWLVKKPNGKLEKPHPKYSFTTEGRKRFCKFIKGVRLPDGFGSNFKQKVTADDNNITGMKSHDCHIMMHRLLPYGVQQYLPKSIAAPIIEFCLFFKQLCARTLMQQDMSEAKKQSISILIELEQIFPPAFFDIMIHVAIHLPDEAILGGPIRYRWMFPFERYMKKLKNYVRNKAKPEGSIAEGYVAEEALTFCSRYLKDVKTRFNRPGRNDDGLPEQPVSWFVLNYSPEVDADILAYREESPDNVETSFPAWFNYKSPIKMFIHGTQFSSHVTLSVGLTWLGAYRLSINAQSNEVDAPPVNDDNANANEDNADFINNEDDVVAHVLDDDDVVVSDDDEVNPNGVCSSLDTRWGCCGSTTQTSPHGPETAQCQSSMLRLETGNRSLRKAFRENNEQPLKIGFDYEDLEHFNLAEMVQITGQVVVLHKCIYGGGKLDMKANENKITACLIPFKTDQEILDEIVPSEQPPECVTRWAGHQNNDEPNVLKGNRVIGVGVNENNKWVDKEVQYSVYTQHVLIPFLKLLDDKHIKKKKMKAAIQRRL
ncbi:uncharacterized protein Tco_1569649 [Tanacetum coccineum]